MTIIDVDIADQRVLEDAISRYGDTPLVVRTASGKFHAYYRHNNERRVIRPWGRDLKIDLLGQGGFVVAPASELAGVRYTIIAGRLDDLDQLPVIRHLPPASNGKPLYLGAVSSRLDRNDSKACAKATAATTRCSLPSVHRPVTFMPLAAMWNNYSHWPGN